jgi:hypothetical protein
LTFWIKVSAMSSTLSEMVPPGLAMKSTAPSASASKVACAPCSVSEDTITTGVGRACIISDSAVRPSISGMLMSSVTTSGCHSVSCCTPSAPLRATAT